MSPSPRTRLFLLLFLFALVWGPGLQVVGGFWRPEVAGRLPEGESVAGGAWQVTALGDAIDDRRTQVSGRQHDVRAGSRPVIGRRSWVQGRVTPTGREELAPIVVYFGHDCDTVRSAARRQLRDLARDLPRGTLVALRGHADSTGPSGYNDALSIRRAEEVRHALRGTGLRVVEPVGSFGERRPAARGRMVLGVPDLRGRALDRRVEILPMGRGADDPPPAVGVAAGPLGPCSG